MDKFMPKTIEQLNAEFEARMEKAKQDELNAAAEKAAAEIKAAEEARKAEEARAVAKAKAAAEARAAAEAKAAEEARRVEERSYDSVIDNSVISANELEPVEDDFEETYSGEEEVSVEESEPEVKEVPVEKQKNEYGEPDPHGYFGAPIDKSRPRKNLFEETASKVEPKFDFERTSDYSGAMLQNGFKPQKDKFKGARIFTTVLIVIIAVVSLVTALLCVAAAHPDKFLLDRGLAVCSENVAGSNIKSGSLCLTRRRIRGRSCAVQARRQIRICVRFVRARGCFNSRARHALRAVYRQVHLECHEHVDCLRLLSSRGDTHHPDNQARGVQRAGGERHRRSQEQEEPQITKNQEPHG